MKNVLMALVALFIGFTAAVGDVEAKRLGGGKSFGMQRSAPASAPPASSRDTASPAPNSATNAAAARQPGATQAAPKRSWLGPLAGLAAGLGLAALASHFGFGEEMASFMLIALAVMAGIFLLRLLMRRAQPAQGGLRPAMAGPQSGAQPLYATAAGAPEFSPVSPAASSAPADFDTAGFLRQAKLNFVRLQTANDSGNLADLREFTAPEVFAELSMQIQERGGQHQNTDVVQLEADLLELATEADQHIASVRFHGLAREDDGAAPLPFDEVWHLAKPVKGPRGWVVAGIQQMQ